MLQLQALSAWIMDQSSRTSFIIQNYIFVNFCWLCHSYIADPCSKFTWVGTVKHLSFSPCFVFPKVALDFGIFLLIISALVLAASCHH
ncbi:hypothetical protein I7I50_02262 [Histoplasma capsulatum G186AR]|uniref:Uncharacterized protein n=1 Tax=Ajellomyces capsulatus TaxID=5037 RepID=A0A8H8D677_AJECA|nr:hypothetical protein I7I52_01074 [Histoplasma capsulatum]QSS71432.1 hypothetical protein I7I50_02262 [Histoplasma capsulatum G186AR]